MSVEEVYSCCHAIKLFKTTCLFLPDVSVFDRYSEYLVCHQFITLSVCRLIFIRLLYKDRQSVSHRDPFLSLMQPERVMFYKKKKKKGGGLIILRKHRYMSKPFAIGQFIFACKMTELPLHSVGCPRNG